MRERRLRQAAGCGRSDRRVDLNFNQRQVCASNLTSFHNIERLHVVHFVRVHPPNIYRSSSTANTETSVYGPSLVYVFVMFSAFFCS